MVSLYLSRRIEFDILNQLEKKQRPVLNKTGLIIYNKIEK